MLTALLASTLCATDGVEIVVNVAEGTTDA